MNVLRIFPGEKIYINGCSDTIELTIVKVGRKYATTDNPSYRYLLDYGCIQHLGLEKSKSHLTSFESAEKAEGFLESKLQELGL